MIGLEVENRPLLRAYSIASPNHEDHQNFFLLKFQMVRLQVNYST